MGRVLVWKGYRLNVGKKYFMKPNLGQRFIEINQFKNPRFLPELARSLKAKLLLKTADGKKELEIKFAKVQPKPYGKFKLYFLCPKCGRKTRRLFLSTNSLLCRECLGKQYFSERWKTNRYYKELAIPLIKLTWLENTLSKTRSKEKKKELEAQIINLAQEVEEKAWKTTEKEYLKLAQALHNYWIYLLERASFLFYLKTNFTKLLTTKHPENSQQFQKLLTQLPKFIKTGQFEYEDILG